MSVNSYKDIIDKLNVNLSDNYKEIEIGLGSDVTVKVFQYLPIVDKINLINFIVESSLDEATGCFSPARINFAYGIGVLQYYSKISFDGLEGIELIKVYDLLESTGIINKVIEAIPEEERDFIQSLVDDTITDIARYNNSVAGIIRTMTNDTTGLNEQIQDILSKIKNKEGLELLAEIKNVVGND